MLGQNLFLLSETTRLAGIQFTSLFSTSVSKVKINESQDNSEDTMKLGTKPVKKTYKKIVATKLAKNTSKNPVEKIFASKELRINNKKQKIKVSKAVKNNNNNSSKKINKPVLINKFDSDSFEAHQNLKTQGSSNNTIYKSNESKVAAGHKSTIKFLDGKIEKVTQPSEVNFQESLYQDDRSTIFKLKQFLPKQYGRGESENSIILENLFNGHDESNMTFIDLKIGTSTLHHHVKDKGSLYKPIKSDVSSTSAKYGFKITGYKVQQNGIITEDFTKKPFKTYQQSVNILQRIFNNQSDHSRTKIIKFIDQLIDFMESIKIDIKGASLFVVLSEKKASIKLIDLASVKNSNIKDLGFIKGLKSLVQILDKEQKKQITTNKAVKINARIASRTKAAVNKATKKAVKKTTKKEVNKATKKAVNKVNKKAVKNTLRK